MSVFTLDPLEIVYKEGTAERYLEQFMLQKYIDLAF
jgi:hypothetical protein